MQQGTARDMLISLHEHFKIRVTDWLLSAIMFSWGLALFAVRPDVWALPTFSGLSSIASQGAWAAAATVVGASRLGALFVNGAVRRSPHLRGLGAFLSLFLWGLLSLSVVLSEYVGPGIAIFPWLALADVFNLYRAMGDAWSSDERATLRKTTAAHAGRA